MYQKFTDREVGEKTGRTPPPFTHLVLIGVSIISMISSDIVEAVRTRRDARDDEAR